MKITFLGSSHGVPAADRYCSCAMLDVGGSLYFIDAGCPLIDILIRRGEDLNRIRGIFTTHLHGDHTNGILAFADLCSWYFKTVRAGIWMTEQAGIDDFRRLIVTTQGQPLDDERLPFHLVQPGKVYEDENVRLTALPTNHLASAGRPAYSYLVEAEGKRILFSGDLSQKLAQEDFPALALEEELDLLVCEMAHFGPEQVTPYLERCKAREVVFNHVFPLEKLDLINAMNGQFGYPVRTVDDNEEIIL